MTLVKHPPYHTIKVKKYSDIIEEYTAVAAITPGMLVELTSANKVQAHSGASKEALPMFAIEDELQGGGVLDDYAAGAQVQVWIPNRGDIVLAILNDGENVVIGDWVDSAGNGCVRKHRRTYESFESIDNRPADSIHEPSIIGQFVEAADLSALDDSNSSLQANSQYVLIRII
jgi:hypothetical protein